MKENNKIHFLEISWKDISVLKELHDWVLNDLIKLMHLSWCSGDELKENKFKIGFLEIYFCSDGRMHFDFSTKFCFDSELQETIRKLCVEVSKNQEEHKSRVSRFVQKVETWKDNLQKNEK